MNLCAEDPDEDKNDHDSCDDPDDYLHFHVLPELLPLDPHGLPLDEEQCTILACSSHSRPSYSPVELLSALLQLLRSVLQVRELAVAFKNLFNVLLHDVLDLIHLCDIAEFRGPVTSAYVHDRYV